MSPYVIIQQVDSFFGLYLSIEIYVLAIQTPENNDPVLFEMFLESQQLGYSSTGRQVYTRRLE
jgi:hypothetical protein